MFWWSKQKFVWPALDLNDIKSRANILAIDDNDFPYIELFRRDGYRIDKWEDVVDLPKLETGSYDLILLDIQGIGRKQSSDQGLGILRHIKQANPSQLVIVFSDADFSLEVHRTLEEADEVLPKGSDYVDFKKSVDKLLSTRFSYGFYQKKIEDLLRNQISDPSKIEKELKSSLSQGDSRSFQRFLQGKVSDPQVIKNVISIVDIAVKIVSLWKH